MSPSIFFLTFTVTLDSTVIAFVIVPPSLGSLPLNPARSSHFLHYPLSHDDVCYCVVNLKLSTILFFRPPNTLTDAFGRQITAFSCVVCVFGSVV